MTRHDLSSTVAPKARKQVKTSVRETRRTIERLREDVAELTTLDRRTTSSGERRSADHLARRLADIGVVDIEKPTFRTLSSWTPPHLAHLGFAVAAAAVDHRRARWAALLATVSYELEVSGRSQWVRRLLPSGRGVSVTGRIPAAGESHRTLVLVAHHDAAQTGLVWSRSAVALSQGLSRRTGRAIPSHAPALLALAMTTSTNRRVRAAGAGLATLTGLLMAQSMASPTTPGANDNASGVAVVLELARRLVAEPLPSTTVLLVLPGGEEVGNSGIRDWLRRTRPQLDPRTTLVVNLDAVGSRGTVAISHREALSNPLPRAAVDRAQRSALAALGFEARAVATPNATDAIPLHRSGLSTISVLSDEDGWISHLHRATDTVDEVDLGTVSDAVRLTEHIATTWAAEGARS